MRIGPLRIGPLERRLLAIAVVALLPVIAFAVYNLVSGVRHQRAELERTTIETIRALTSAVDRELHLTAAALRVLSESNRLTNDDIRGFAQMARRAREHFPAWETVILADVSGNQMMNLLDPAGTRPGRVVDEEGHRAAVKTASPVFGGVAPDPASKAQRYSVHVPVRRGGRVVYVLSAVVRPESMMPVLYHQRMMAQGVISVTDASGKLVARSRGQEQFVGKPPAPSVQQLVRGAAEGWGATTGLQNERFYTAFSRSPDTGWTVIAGMQRDIIDGPMHRAMLALALGVVLSLAVGVVAALTASRIISRPIDGLREAARAYGRGELFDVPEPDLPELRELAQALAIARSDRDRLLQREREARSAAESANRSKDEFLAMLGHELRNPLAAISNGIVVLERKVDVTQPDAQHVTDILRRQTEHLTRLVDDLLDVGRVVTGKIMLDRKPVDLAKIVRLTVETFQSTGRLAHHRVEVEAHSAWALADSTRMEQVCSNLITNACKFTPAGRGIHVSVAGEGDFVVLRVRDEGIGLTPGLARSAFELFVQGDQLADRSQGGLGIGLTLVKRLVELHGGTVEARSEGRDKGSEFVMRLPAVPAMPAAPAIRIAPYNPRRVLIVEDNADARATLRMVLAMQGHTVYEAVDGPSGVAAARQQRPDVVLMDIGLPGYDGVEAARRIRADLGDSVRLIALSGYGLDEDKRRAGEAGFDLHLIKPVNDEALAEAILGLARSNSKPLGA